jgi:hypothetical protein
MIAQRDRGAARGNNSLIYIFNLLHVVTVQNVWLDARLGEDRAHSL